MARRLLAPKGSRIVRSLAILVVATLAVTGGSAAGLFGGATAWAAADDNLVLKWNQAALDSITDTAVPGIRRAPPVAARSLAIAHTAIYDAWAAYDNTAKPTNGARASGSPADQQLAVSHAAYETLTALFGRKAAADILAARASDGANAPSYADPADWNNSPANINKPTPTPVVVTPEQPHVQPIDPNKWQPLINPDGTVQTWLLPHWAFVKPWALSSGSALRPSGPALRLTGSGGGAKGGNGLVIQEVNQALNYSAGLNDQTKAQAWYWSDGPNSVTPPGHWNLIAQAVSRQRRHTLGQDAKLFFALNTALLDAGIVAWDAKRAYNSMRPITAVRWLNDGKTIRAWKPNHGTVLMNGTEWRPCRPTPPFAEYTSGHSTFSNAAAEVLRSFTGTDSFSFSTTVAQGSIPTSIETGVPTKPVTLSWSSFTDLAASASLSRQIGGIHFQDGDLHARTSGTSAGTTAYTKAKGYFKKTA